MKKVLFVCLHRPDRSPSQRFRFEQYLDYLRHNGFDCEFSWLLNEQDDKYFYNQGKLFQKAVILIKSILKRTREILKASGYSIVFVQRESFMLGTTFFEKQFAKKTKLIFDFDDSIWLQNVSDANKMFSFFKNAGKTKKIIELSHLVFSGNNYLADYAKKFNKNVVVIPTTIDTKEYSPVQKKQNNGVCIGWSGSITTIQHLKTQITALRQIKKKFGDKVYFKVIGDANFYDEELGVKGIDWKIENEIEELSEFDIGIMPLPDSEWAKGKCGLKGLQYLSLEIPTIMSPVGVNSDIIVDGENGFLADGTDEWVKKISLLVESETLRKVMGKKGRQIVLEKYSVEANKDLYLKYFNSLLMTE